VVFPERGLRRLVQLNWNELAVERQPLAMFASEKRRP
jgi:hypothetical protein